MTTERATLVQWTEPYGPDQKQTLICLMSKADIIAWQMSRTDVTYTDPEDAFDDFCVVHWAKDVPPLVAEAVDAQDEFNAERAKDSTLDSLWFARETVIANNEALLPKIMAYFGAPTQKHAEMGVEMTIKILTLIAHEIQATPVEQLQDAMTKKVH